MMNKRGLRLVGFVLGVVGCCGASYADNYLGGTISWTILDAPTRVVRFEVRTAWRPGTASAVQLHFGDGSPAAVLSGPAVFDPGLNLDEVTVLVDHDYADATMTSTASFAGCCRTPTATAGQSNYQLESVVDFGAGVAASPKYAGPLVLEPEALAGEVVDLAVPGGATAFRFADAATESLIAVPTLVTFGGVCALDTCLVVEGAGLEGQVHAVQVAALGMGTVRVPLDLLLRIVPPNIEPVSFFTELNGGAIAPAPPTTSLMAQVLVNSLLTTTLSGTDVDATVFEFVTPPVAPMAGAPGLPSGAAVDPQPASMVAGSPPMLPAQIDVSIQWTPGPGDFDTTWTVPLNFQDISDPLNPQPGLPSTLTIVVPPNSPPVPVADGAMTNEETSVDIPLATIVGNDGDAEMMPLSVTGLCADCTVDMAAALIMTANGATAEILNNGMEDVVRYTPTFNFPSGTMVGQDSFQYVVSDGMATAAGTITVDVAAVADLLSIAVDTDPLAVPPSTATQNTGIWTDGDRQVPTVASVDLVDPMNPATVLAANFGSVTVDPLVDPAVDIQSTWTWVYDPAVDPALSGTVRIRFSDAFAPAAVETTFGFVIQPACAGDANGDNMVNFTDVTTVLGNWLNDYTPGTGPGDANNDGLVNFTDVTVVLGNWLAVCP